MLVRFDKGAISAPSSSADWLALATLSGVHDAGAIAYYGDGRVYDMLGLITNHQAGIANNGPGARFEFLESLPPEQRFSHFAYYPGWLGTTELFGEVLLHLAMNGPTPDSQQLSALFGREERSFKLTDRPMVHLTYQTAFVDDSGKLQLREDLYGFDERIRTILHSDERRIADLAPSQDAKREQPSAQVNQDILRRVERGQAPNASEFFDNLPSEPPRSEPGDAALQVQDAFDGSNVDEGAGKAGGGEPVAQRPDRVGLLGLDHQDGRSHQMSLDGHPHTIGTSASKGCTWE